MKYKIVNMVAFVDLKQTLDPYALAAAIKEVEYEPEQFPGAVLKLKEPKVSMLLFKNGKIIVSGVRQEKDIPIAVKKALKLAKEVQPEIKIRKKIDYTIVNMVASTTLNRKLDLFELALNLDNIEYEPEQFPGAVMKITEPKASLLIFLNGQVICAGLKNEKDMNKALNKSKRLIEKAIKPKQKKQEKTTRKNKPKTRIKNDAPRL